jgi:NitT/TauT family transport system substrate-binding protein
MLAFIMPGLLGCARAPEDSAAPAESGLRRVKLQLNWFPEAEHGGFYAAQIHGYYVEEGLDVEIVAGGTNVPVIQQVARGRVPFGIANAEQVLVGRAQDADVVALLAPMQHFPRCIMVHAESGIESFDQLNNLTLAVGEAKVYVDFLKAAAPLEKVKFVPYGGNVSRFVQHKNHAQQAYVFSEPFLAEQQGAKTRCLMISDLGFDPYAGLLIANGSVARGDEELIRKMVHASRRGWRTYLENPEPTNRRLLELNDQLTPAALAYGVERLRSLCLPDGLPPERLGEMTAARWRKLADQLVRLKAIDRIPAPIEEAFWRPGE